MRIFNRKRRLTSANLGNNEIPKANMGGYICQRCSQYHEGVPLSYAVDAPLLWHQIPEREKKRNCKLTSDICIINDEYFFVAGNIEIPIINSDSIFKWIVWVSLSQNNFIRTTDLWYEQGREVEPPYFGWLSVELPVYPISTGNLKTLVHTRPVGVRPFVELEPSDHPLAVEQREGITMERVQQIAEIFFHGQA